MKLLYFTLAILCLVISFFTRFIYFNANPNNASGNVWYFISTITFVGAILLCVMALVAPSRQRKQAKRSPQAQPTHHQQDHSQN